MEFLGFIGIAALTLAAISWRRSHVIETATDAVLINELMRRAYQRRLKAEADAEVEKIIQRS